MFDPGVVGPTVDFLAALAGDGAALEFGIGTGRIALPLSERGVAVTGIDLSTAMVERLRAKPGSDRVATTIGDFATERVEGTFRLVYLLFNTIMNLTTQDDQVACFANAAAHLEPGGCFVVEVGVPDLRRLPPGERFRPFEVTPNHLGFDEYTDLVEQTMSQPSLSGRRRRPRGVLGALPLRVAVRARPDGAPRRPHPSGAVGGLVASAVHRREQLPRLGVAAPALLIRPPDRTGVTAPSVLPGSSTERSRLPDPGCSRRACGR